LGVRGAHRLVEHFGSAQGAYMASLTELEGSGTPARVAHLLYRKGKSVPALSVKPVRRFQSHPTLCARLF